MSHRRQGICLWAALLVMLSMTAHAQSTDGVDPYEEYGKHLRAAQDVTPLKSNLFGDQVSLYNGQTEFDVTDIDLPGNSDLPVQLRRRLVINDRRKDPGNLGGMGEWDLEVPYIDGTFTQQNGWTIGGDANLSYARCSDQDSPPDTYVPPYTNEGDYAQVWDGNQMHIPGGVDDELLINTEAKLPALADGNTYPWVTKSYYRLSCLAGTANGYPGEAFVAVTPNGERYTFNWAVVHTAPALKMATSSGGHTYSSFINRSRIFLLATEVQDRFGNWVKYTYNSNNQLTAITANDGREIDITWSGNTVSSASAGSRTWSYGYANGALSTVTRPDGSQWSYTPLSGSMMTIKGGFPGDYVPPNNHCQLEPDPNTGAFVYAVDAPSGAHATFTFNYQRHYRNDVPYSCMDGNPYHLYPEVFTYFDNFSLVSKQITGAGLAALSWSYDYGDGAEGNYFTPSVPGPIDGNAETYIPQGLCPTCLSSKVVTVTEPGDIIKYTFGTSYANDEGRLLQTETDSLTGQFAKAVTNTYLADDQIANEPFPDNAGRSVLPIYKNPMVARLRPVIMTTTTQDGDTYTHQTEAFDAFAQPTQTKRFNNIAGQQAIEEQTIYDNDLTHWVLGQPQQVDNLSTGETESLRVYDPTTALMTSQSRFGEQLLSYTYNTAGQLASFTDGNSHTTSLSNYYRGIPRLINYPDGTSQSATVDDYGDITAVTDQAGHTTSYTYNAVGWPSQIIYPTGDEAAWYPKTFSFAYVSGAERGIPGGHWRRTVSTGNDSEVTYFDAMLRPLLSDSSIVGTAGSDITSANSYDWRGLTTFAAYPVSGAPDLSALTTGTHKAYDTLGRPTTSQQDSELGTLTSTIAYLSGAGVQVTDPKGNVTTSYAQVFDQPSYDAPIKVQAPAGVTQTISRDLYGHPLSITQSGLYNGTETDSVTKTLTYDAYHRLCRSTEPESGSTVMDYDGANNPAWSAAGLSITGTGCGQEQVPAASKTALSYDAMNRVLTIAPPAGTQSTQYTYTALGQPSQVVSGISTWAGSYNYRGMLTGESLQLVGKNAWGIGYGHDAYGSLSVISYPNGETVSYAPDARGRPTQVGNYASGIGYFANGQVSQFIYGNGTAFVAEQNTRQMLRNFSYGNGGTPQLSEDLSYDANGNITTVTDLTGGPRNKSFGYDALNRLTSAQATGLWGSETYSYDPLNNLRTRLSAGQTLTYNYDVTNKLTGISNGASTVSSFLYDNRGNVTSKNGNSLVFDQKNQLTQIPGYDSYAYDAAGRRVVKTPASGSAVENYFYDHAGQLMYQFEPATTKTTNFIYLGSKLIARNAAYTTHVLGNIDGVNIDASNNATISGWACSTGLPQSIGVEVFAGGPSGGGGTRITTATANVASEPAVATACQSSGSAYRFSVPLSSAMRSQYPGAVIYMYGDSPVGVGNLVLNASGSFTIPVNVPSTAPNLSVPASNGTGSYTVSWGGVSGATSYTLQEQVNSGGWSTVQTSGSSSWGASGKGNGSYGYKVQGCNISGCGPWSSVASTTVLLPPSAPSSITVPPTSSGTVGVSWPASATATSYTLQQRLGGGGWSTVYSGAATSYSSAVSASGSYAYQVQACNASGCSTFVASSAVAVTLPPASAPSVSVPASNNNGSYTVSWSGVSGATSYTLQEQVNGGGWSTVQASGSTSWGAGGKGNGSYGYHAQACNVSGCGPWSSVVSTTVLLPPSAPASISVPATSNGPIAISWAASATATIYGVDQSVNGGAWAQVYANSATSTTVTVGTSGSYSYRAYACNGGGCNGYATSGAVTVTIPPASAPSLSVPTSNHSGSYTVSWGGVGGATSYTLQQQVNGGGWGTIQNSSATSLAIGGEGNGSYGYRVQACNVGGCGPWSATGTVAVTLPPAAPASVTAPSYVHGVQYYVTWSASAGATSYNVQKTNYSLGTTTIVATTSATSATMAAPNSSESLQYAVQACSAAGCSAFTYASNGTQTDPPGPIR